MTEENDAPLLTQEELDSLFGQLEAIKRKDGHPITDASDASGKGARESVTSEIANETGTGGTGAMLRERVSRDASDEAHADEAHEQTSPSASIASELARTSDGFAATRIFENKDRTTDTFRTTLNALSEIPVTISVRVGSARAPLDSVSAMGPGTVLRLDTLVNEPVKLLVDDVVIAEGEMVEVGGYFGVRIKTAFTFIS